MTPEKILSAIKKYKHFLIFGHEGPDADCLGSQLALASFLKRIGKTTALFSAGPFLKPEILSMEALFSPMLPKQESLPSETMAVLLDCSSPSRTAMAVELLDVPWMVIDHHASGNNEMELAWIDSSSPSTTLLIQELIENYGETPSSQEAEWLFLGFATDTGFFRHLEEGCKRSFLNVSRLADCGINPSKTYKRMVGGKDLPSQKLVARGIERAKLFFDGNLLLTYETLQDYKDLQLESRDSGTLYQILQSIGGCQVVVLLKEMNDNKVSISFRSSSDLNVGEIAKTLGGGGHPKASGCALEGNLNQVRDQILELFSRYF